MFPPVCFNLPVVVAISFRKVAREWRVGESFRENWGYCMDEGDNGIVLERPEKE